MTDKLAFIYKFKVTELVSGQFCLYILPENINIVFQWFQGVLEVDFE